MTKKITTYIYTSIFLILAFLISTPNFSVGIVILLFLFASYYLIKYRASLKIKKIDLFVIFAASSCFLSFIPVAIIDGTTLRYFDPTIRFLISIPIYLLIRDLLINKKLDLEIAKRTIEYGAIAGSIGALILALYQSMILGFPRVNGFTFSINFGYMACSLGFITFVFFKNSNHKIINAIAVISATIATFLTFTRGAIIAIPVLLVMTLVIQYKDRITIKNTIIFLAGISIICTLTYQLFPKVKNRMDYTTFEIQNIIKGDTVKASSSGGRIELWYGAIEAFKQNPIIGKSYTDREEINQKFYDSGQYKNRVILASRAHAHSQYFEIIASSGLLGIFAFVLYLIAPLIYYFKSIVKNRDNIFAVAGFVFTTGIAIFGLTEVLLEANLISTFYAVIQVIFLAFAISYNSEKS